MTEMLYIFLFFTTEVMVLLAFRHCSRQRGPVVQPLQVALGSAFCAILSYGIALFIPSMLVSRIMYAIYFCSFTWMCAALTYFALCYTHSNIKFVFRKYLMYALMALDCISNLLNIVWPHSYTVEREFSGKIAYWNFVQLPCFPFHLLLCYTLIVLMLVIMLRPCLTVPRLYRTQYIVPTLVICIIVLLNAVFLLSQQLIDVSVLAYGVTAYLLCYFTFRFLPQRMMDGMRRLMVNNMESAVLLFNRYGECLYTNRLAGKWLSLKKEGLMLDDFREILRLDRKTLTADFRKKLTVSSAAGIRYYQTQFVRLKDTKESEIGCFFVLNDETESTLNYMKEKYLVTHDALTGIYNKQAFISAAQEVMQQYGAYAYCIVVTNIQQFKLLNDMLGKEAGDCMLRTIAQNLKDIQRLDVVVGRLDSDHFAICAPKRDIREQDFYSKPELLHEQLGFSVAILCNFGIYEVTDSSVPVEIMCDRAMMAMNSLRGDVQCRVAYYDKKMRSDLMMENRLVSEFPEAMEKRQFELYFQPQFDFHTGAIVGAEALVRWLHPKLGLLSPGHFIPLFERNGLIPQLDYYCWDMACQTIRYLRGIGLPVAISVNISTRDFYSRDLYQVFTDLIKKYHIPAESIKLEITESVAILDVKKQHALLVHLQEAGFRIEMDDFGSGYSSLNTLKDIPVDVLKMDMRFLENSANEELSEKILRMVIALANSMQIPVIAEGVETREQAESLANMGCRFIQGFYYAKPMPLEEMIEKMRHTNIDDLNRMYVEEQNAWTGGFYRELLEKQCRQYDIKVNQKQDPAADV